MFFLKQVFNLADTYATEPSAKVENKLWACC